MHVLGNAPPARAIDHLHQAVAVVPDVVGHRAGGDVRPLDAVPVGVVRVVVRAVREKLIVRADYVTAARAVAVGVVRCRIQRDWGLGIGD